MTTEEDSGLGWIDELSPEEREKAYSDPEVQELILLHALSQKSNQPSPEGEKIAPPPSQTQE